MRLNTQKLFKCIITSLLQRLCEVYTMSRRGFGSCPQCSDNVPAARKHCVGGCDLKKGRGRSKGTTRIQGYGVNTSGGRPVCTTAEEGYGVSPGAYGPITA